MTQDHFESLVRRLEQEAATNPTGYRRKLGALAFLGYSYILATLILLAAGTGLLLWVGITLNHAMLLLGWVLLFLIYVVVRAMWVRLDPPHGRPLTPVQCPELFALIEDLRTRASAPRVDRVLLTSDFNAAI